MKDSWENLSFCASCQALLILQGIGWWGVFDAVMIHIALHNVYVWLPAADDIYLDWLFWLARFQTFPSEPFAQHSRRVRIRKEWYKRGFRFLGYWTVYLLHNLFCTFVGACCITCRAIMRQDSPPMCVLVRIRASSCMCERHFISTASRMLWNTQLLTYESCVHVKVAALPSCWRLSFVKVELKLPAAVMGWEGIEKG